MAFNSSRVEARGMIRIRSGGMSASEARCRTALTSSSHATTNLNQAFSVPARQRRISGFQVLTSLLPEWGSLGDTLNCVTRFSSSVSGMMVPLVSISTA